MTHYLHGDGDAGRRVPEDIDRYIQEKTEEEPEFPCDLYDGIYVPQEQEQKD